MAKAIALLRKLGQLRKQAAEETGVFDSRLEKLGDVRRVSVARSVLFRTEPPRPAA